MFDSAKAALAADEKHAAGWCVRHRRNLVVAAIAVVAIMGALIWAP